MTTSTTNTSRAHYSPPWADVTIIGIAGSSGSGKSTLSHAIVSTLNLPWVVILSMVRTLLDDDEVPHADWESRTLFTSL